MERPLGEGIGTLLIGIRYVIRALSTALVITVRGALGALRP
jgi:hypothetical protein